jgi:hypothetical protein
VDAFAPAEEWIKAHPKYQLANVQRQAIALPNSAQSPSGEPREQLTDPAEAKELFRDFLRYARQESETRTANGSSGTSDELRTQLFTEFLEYQKAGKREGKDRQPFHPDQMNATLLNLRTGK